METDRIPLALLLVALGVIILTLLLSLTNVRVIEFLLDNPIIIILLGGWYLGRPVIAGILHRIHQSRYEETIENLDGDLPSVTVQMPAYNEEDFIETAIESVRSQNYPGDVEIIAVDDGSTDRTWQILQRLAEKYSELKVYTKENEGLAPTRNYALSKGENEIVVSMDSDTKLEENALISLVLALADDDVVAVGGNVETWNDTESWWTRAQSLEYLVSMEMARMFQSRFRHLLCASGACSAFTRDILEKVGGWQSTGWKYTEDFEISIRLHEYGKLSFEPNAIALTECPTGFRAWWNQRMFWAGGGLRTVLRHRRALFNPSFSLLGLFALPLKLGLTLWLLLKFYGFILSFASKSFSEIQSLLIEIVIIGSLGTAALALVLLGIISLFVIYRHPLQNLTYLPQYIALYRPVHVLVRIVAFTTILATIGYEIVANRSGQLKRYTWK